MQKNIIRLCLEKNILIDKKAIDFISKNNLSLSELSKNKLNNIHILTEDKLIELMKPIEIKKKSKNLVVDDYESKVDIIKTFQGNPGEKTIETFVNYYNYRYNKLKDLLFNRPELKNLISLGRLHNSIIEGQISVIGMVNEIKTTKNNNILIELEDPTGKIVVIIKEGKDIGEDRLIADEVVGVTGTFSKGLLFANSILFPDVPLPTKINRIRDPINAVFISDLHFGSNKFLSKISENFIKWISSDEKEASKTKYLFIAGDVVDGVGIYPNQHKELTIKDIYAQYNAFEEFIYSLPEHLQIIICPGNHDAIRQAEPQPPLTKELLPNIFDLKNIHLVSNPCYVNIHGIDSSGLSVLMYHGYSFSKIIDRTPYLREKGTTQPIYVMREVLKKRCLAPPIDSTLFSPENTDYLLIDKIPDIFHTADLHSFGVDNYKGITSISSSTFQDQTSFMDRVGHIANPGKVTIVSLNDRKVIVKDFIS